MTVGHLDLEVPKGARVVQPILVTTDGSVVSLTPGTKALMQVRRSEKSNTVLAELSTENGRLALDVTTALLTITMPSDFTATLDFERARYDIFLIYPDLSREKIVEGKVFVFASITRVS